MKLRTDDFDIVEHISWQMFADYKPTETASCFKVYPQNYTVGIPFNHLFLKRV